MSEWETLLTEPAGLGEDEARWDAWFSAMATRLLTGTRFLVGDEPHRFTEVEMYYYGGPHKDPFTHRDPIQKATGRWYFHRTRGVYRGGSFKGIDLTFGGPDSFGGILIRGVEGPGENLIDGPSLTVDHLLSRTEAATVATLDEAIAGRACWDPDNPLRLEMIPVSERTLLRTARVGLTLKRLRKSPEPLRYLLRNYRYLSEPRRISKGKPHMVLALHARGEGIEQISQATGCPRGTVKRYVDEFEAGRAETDLDAYFGIDLGTTELCRLHGAWHTRWGKKPTE
jgi:hypothetical protein